MTSISAPTRTASTQQINQDRATATSIHQINQLNQAAKLGSLSVRFFRTGSEGFYPKSTELTPERALLEMMAGHEVEATVVTWREQRSGGKAHPQPHHNAPMVRKVRTKVYNGPQKKFESAKDFENWWTAVKEVAAENTNTGTTTRTRGRSRKHW